MKIDSIHESPPIAILIADDIAKPDHAGKDDVKRLPIAGKNVLMRNLDELMIAGIKQALVIATKQADEIQQWADHGQRCGIDLNIEVFRYSIDSTEIIKQFASLADQSGLLVVDAYKLRTNCLATLIEQTKQQSLQHVEFTVQDKKLGVSYLNHSKYRENRHVLDFENHRVKVNPLESFQDYFDANLDILHGKLKGQKPQAEEKNSQGLYIHHHTHIHHGSTLSSEVMVGEHCHISDKTVLKNVVLNQDVYVDKFCVLDNVVVLPGTYLKKKSKLSNVIITPTRVIEIAA